MQESVSCCLIMIMKVDFCTNNYQHYTCFCSLGFSNHLVILMILIAHMIFVKYFYGYAIFSVRVDLTKDYHGDSKSPHFEILESRALKITFSKQWFLLKIFCFEEFLIMIWSFRLWYSLVQFLFEYSLSILCDV